MGRAEPRYVCSNSPVLRPSLAPSLSPPAGQHTKWPSGASKKCGAAPLAWDSQCRCRGVWGPVLLGAGNRAAFLNGHSLRLYVSDNISSRLSSAAESTVVALTRNKLQP